MNVSHSERLAEKENDDGPEKPGQGQHQEHENNVSILWQEGVAADD